MAFARETSPNGFWFWVFAADLVWSGFAELVTVLLVEGGAQPVSVVKPSILAPLTGHPWFLKLQATKFDQCDGTWLPFGFKRSFPMDKYPSQERLDAREPTSDEFRISPCR